MFGFVAIGSVANYLWQKQRGEGEGRINMAKIKPINGKCKADPKNGICNGNSTRCTYHNIDWNGTINMMCVHWRCPTCGR